MKAPFKLALNIALLSGMSLVATTASATDKELLNTLLENGVLTKAQHEKLVSQADEKPSQMTSSSLKDMDWASRIKLSGDMRVRQEFIDRESTGVRNNRQRIRARLGLSAKVNDEVDVGFRIVTTGGRTSTNQNLGDSFSGKSLFIDRAFINWHPEFADGLNVIAGKFKQPWYGVSDLVWDGDVNPEGLALKYSKQIGSATLTATGGYFIVQDAASSTGNDGFSDDLNMYHAGISGAMKFNDSIKASLGYNAYIFNNTRNDFAGAATVNSLPDATGTSAYKLHEVAGQVDIDTGLLPIKVYGQYVFNAGDVRNAAGIVDEQDSAWLAGIATKYGPFSLDYNYRDTQRDGVASAFNDSDFNGGATAARGHKIKGGYKISKNFALG